MLSVLVLGTSTYKEDKFLGVQRLKKASGTAQADASYDLLEMWNLKQHAKALVFDTTASSTDWNSSAAKCLEVFRLKAFLQTDRQTDRQTNLFTRIVKTKRKKKHS